MSVSEWRSCNYSLTARSPATLVAQVAVTATMCYPLLHWLTRVTLLEASETSVER